MCLGVGDLAGLWPLTPTRLAAARLAGPGLQTGRTAACVPLQPQGVWPAGLPPVRSPFALAPSPWETNLCHLRQVAEEGGTQIANAAPGHLLGRLVPGQPRVVPLHSW